MIDSTVDELTRAAKEDDFRTLLSTFNNYDFPADDYPEGLSDWEESNTERALKWMPQM